MGRVNTSRALNVLNGILWVNLGWLVAALIFLTRGFGAKFHGPDALPDTNQQKHTGLRLF